MKDRLDRVLVARGLALTREKAQALILAGSVTVNGARAEKAGHAVDPDATINIARGPQHVSRGGQKLEAALAHFAIEVAGKVCLDVGASTGGFTDCLLQHGAARVHAIDAGTGQLDWTLRNDPRVVVRERFNARHLTAADIGEPIGFAVCDVSFISATLLCAPIASTLAPDASIVILVKPQFEAGKGQVGKGGIVRDPAIHAAACDRVRAAVEALGFHAAIIPSPILGAEGNREFLLCATRPAAPAPTAP